MNTAFERTEQKDEWLTPPYIFQALGDFDLDPCAPVNPPWNIAHTWFDKNADGLSQPWFGFVWCNPPYGKQTASWLQRMRQHDNGIALVFARTDTKMFHDYCFEADGILFLKGRLSFYTVQGKKGGTAGAPSCLVAFGAEALGRLERCSLKGKLCVS